MAKNADIYYFRFPNCDSKEQKLKLLDNSKFEKLVFERVIPDDKGNWINQTDNDFDSFIPVCDKQVKSNKAQNAIFRLFSNGVSTNRDEWVYDFSKENLENKMQFFFDEYNYEVDRWGKWKKDNIYQDISDESNPVVDKFLHERNLIKWSKMLKRDKLRKHKKEKFNKNDIVKCFYRPFVKNYLYYGYTPIDIKGEFNSIFLKENNDNRIIFFTNNPRGDFSHLSSKYIVDLNIYVNSPIIYLPLYVYDKEGNPHWALTQFKNHYIRTGSPEINKLDIFHYIYAVLHNPAYREKYQQNLKREFPHIPFYDDFTQWAEWGRALMDLHLQYETVEPYP